MTNLPMRAALGALLLITPLLACEKLFPPRASLTVPTAAQADSVFRAHGMHGTVAIRGNVVEFTAEQRSDQLRRGGELWARVGPFIYVFSPATVSIFESYPGVAAVRTRTLVADAEVARALLVRDTLRAGEWRQAQGLLARALREGTTRPSRLEELVRFGERFTTFDYNPAYVAGGNQRGE